MLVLLRNSNEELRLEKPDKWKPWNCTTIASKRSPIGDLSIARTVQAWRALSNSKNDSRPEACSWTFVVRMGMLRPREIRNVTVLRSSPGKSQTGRTESKYTNYTGRRNIYAKRPDHNPLNINVLNKAFKRSTAARIPVCLSLKGWSAASNHQVLIMKVKAKTLTRWRHPGSTRTLSRFLIRNVHEHGVVP